RAGHGAGRVGAAPGARRRAGAGAGERGRSHGQRLQRRDAQPADGGRRQLGARRGPDACDRPGGRPAAGNERHAPEHRGCPRGPLRRTMGFLINLLLLVLLVVALAAWVMLPWQGALLLAVLLAGWLMLTRRGAQARSVAQVGISTLGQRLGSSAVIVVGIAGVVGVLVALLAMAEGYSETLRKTGSADTAIVMRGASASEVMSVLGRDSVTLIPQAPGVARNDKGEPIASSELVVAANLPQMHGGPDEEGSVQLRGVDDQAFAVRPQVKVVEGRRFQPGLRELIVGRGAARQFS